MKAWPFYAGVRFRWGMPFRTCQNSECSQLCLDFHKLGAHNILADPTVQVSTRRAAEGQGGCGGNR